MNDRNKNILIVDDDPCFLIFCEKLLQSLGHNIITARSAESAITEIVKLRNNSSQRLDFLLIDQNMEGMSGVNLLSYYKEMTNETIPIVLMSSDESRELKTRAKSLGAMTFVSKPITNKIGFMRMVDTFIAQ
jgi:CheY-like chemotaxis protein